MGTISIIYLIIVGISCAVGAYVGIKSIIDTRNNSIEQYLKNREKRRKEFENGKY